GAGTVPGRAGAGADRQLTERPMNATTTTAPAEPAPTKRPAVGRDRFLDVVRLLVMVLVVLQHWWLPVLAVEEGTGTLDASSVLTAEGGFAVTWVSQVMPRSEERRVGKGRAARDAQDTVEQDKASLL